MCSLPVKKSKLTDSRPVFKPFSYQWAYDAWLKSERMHWIHTEIQMLDDLNDWKHRLSESEKYFLAQIFKFFTQGDIDVSDGYVNRYLPVFPQPEVRMMLLSFAAREAMHVAAYSHLVETLGMPDSTYSEFLNYQEMRDKHDYVYGFNGSSVADTAKQIAVFSAFTEGMQLFSSFIMLLNFQRNGLMKGMGQIVAWSVKDETLHCESMIKLFRTYIEENRSVWTDSLKSDIYGIAERMVELEDKFIDLSFSMGDMNRLTAADVKKYIRYIADRRLISLGLKGIFKVKQNPLPWVEEMLNAPAMVNFFESRATDYSKGAMTGSWDDVWAQPGKK